MKFRVLVALLATAVLSGSAFAADLPTKAPLKAAPLQPIQWTGFYVGGQFGALWSRETRDTISPLTEVFSQSGSGWLGGGQIGFDYQFAPYALVGVEAALSGVSLRKESPSVVFPPSHYITQVDWLGTVTARAGYVAGPWLLYARGGYAATKVTFIGTTPGDFVSVGGTRHYDSTTTGGLPLNANVAFKLDSVMLRANYRFGG